MWFRLEDIAMPIYEYQCTGCETRFEELINNDSDEADVICPLCQTTKVFKVMSQFAVGSSASPGAGEPLPPCAAGGGCGGGGCGGKGHH